MLYENTLGNPFVDINFMNNQFTETMKAQERIAIKESRNNSSRHELISKPK